MTWILTILKLRQTIISLAYNNPLKLYLKNSMSRNKEYEADVMSIFDHNVNDSMDKMFDLNNDGKIDSGEQSFMYEAYDKTINK